MSNDTVLYLDEILDKRRLMHTWPVLSGLISETSALFQLPWNSTPSPRFEGFYGVLYATLVHLIVATSFINLISSISSISFISFIISSVLSRLVLGASTIQQIIIFNNQETQHICLLFSSSPLLLFPFFSASSFSTFSNGIPF